MHTVLSETQLGNHVETNMYLLPCNAKYKDPRIDTLWLLLFITVCHNMAVLTQCKKITSPKFDVYLCSAIGVTSVYQPFGSDTTGTFLYEER